MTYSYIILGSGRQGTAAAYDLAKYGDAHQVMMADINTDIAKKSADRINRLIGRNITSFCQLDVSDMKALIKALRGMDVALSAVTYHHNLAITQACIETGVGLNDMGGNTDVVWKQLEFDSAAKQAGVSIVPDCGMGPGLINTIGVYVMEMFDQPHEVLLYDAGLPQNPVPPWNYQCAFHLNGLTNEYDGQATFIRDGKLIKVDTFTELEYIDYLPFGRLEAIIISGSMSTTPYTHLGKLQRYENRILRHPGHFEQFKSYKMLGLFSEDLIEVDSHKIVPRHVYHKLLEPRVSSAQNRDICIMRAVGVGEKNNRTGHVTVDLVDRYDETTGFTGMERLTGFHCAIMMIFQARKTIGAGAHRMESAVTAASVMEEVRKRRIDFSVNWE